MSLRQSAAAYVPPPPEAVPTPELPEPTAYVAVMDGPRRDAYDQASYAWNADKKEFVFARHNATARPCAYAACSADGSWCWTLDEMDEAVKQVGALPGPVLIRLYQVVARLNQLRDSDVADAKKNSRQEAASVSAATGSPPPAAAPSGSCSPA